MSGLLAAGLQDGSFRSLLSCQVAAPLEDVVLVAHGRHRIPFKRYLPGLGFTDTTAHHSVGGCVNLLSAYSVEGVMSAETWVISETFGVYLVSGRLSFLQSMAWLFLCFQVSSG